MVSPELSLVQDMAIIVIIAAATSLLFKRLRLSSVLGFILAGVIVGPFTPPFQLVRDADAIALLGQLGIVFLLFAVGLEFNIGKLRKLGASTVLAAILQAALILWLGYTVGRAFGFGYLESLFLGAIISVSSTSIIVTVLREMGKIDDDWAQVVMGITLVEDIIAVVVLTILSAAGGGGTPDTGVGELLLRLVLFFALALVLGPLLIPRAIDAVARRVPDVLLLVSVSFGLGAAILAAYLGFSTALGAFVAGALIGEGRMVRSVTDRIAPVRDLFAAVFFVTVGMLFDPRLILAQWPVILVTSIALILGKTLFAGGAAFLTGRSPSTSIHVGMSLSPLGEFSFIIAAAAATLGYTEAPLYAIAVGVSAITAFAAPLLIRGAPRAARYYEEHAPLAVRSYAALYGSWIRRLTAMRTGDPAREHAQREGIKAILYGASGLAVIAVGAFFVQTLGAAAQGALRLGETTILGLGWLVVALVAAPFVLLFVRALSRFSQAIAQAALSQGLRDSESSRSARAALQRTFLLVGVAIFGAVAAVIVAPLVSSGPFLVLMGVILALTAALFVRALTTFQRRIDETLTEIVTGEKRTRQGLADRLRQEYPWEVSAREVEVPEDAAVAHRTLRELHLRNRTGATVVAVYRDDTPFFNPAPDTLLQPHDVLAIVGEPHELNHAETLLTAPRSSTAVEAPSPASSWEQIRIDSESRLSGKTLAEARLRETTGATVVGIQRDEERALHPPPSFRLEAGDVVFAIGSDQAIAELRRLAQS